MKFFVVQHIDSLVMTAAGLFMWAYGYRIPAGYRATKFLRIGGPVVAIGGLMLMFFAERPPAPNWQRYQTSDGFASIEFPGTPEASQKVETLNGISVPSTSLIYDVPYREISLHLSFSPIPEGLRDVPDAEQLAGYKADLTEQGFSIVHETSEQFGVASGYGLEVERDGGKARVGIRLVYVAGKVYRVVASSVSTHDDDIVKHFLASFQIERAGG